MRLHFRCAGRSRTSRASSTARVAGPKPAPDSPRESSQATETPFFFRSISLPRTDIQIAMAAMLVVFVSSRGALATLAGVPSVERHVQAGKTLGFDVTVVYPPERRALGAEIRGLV